MLFGGKVKDPRANGGRAAYAGDAWLLTLARPAPGGAAWTPLSGSEPVGAAAPLSRWKACGAGVDGAFYLFGAAARVRFRSRSAANAPTRNAAANRPWNIHVAPRGGAATRPRTIHVAPRGGAATCPRTIHVAPRGGAATRPWTIHVAAAALPRPIRIRDGTVDSQAAARRTARRTSTSTTSGGSTFGGSRPGRESRKNRSGRRRGAARGRRPSRAVSWWPVAARAATAVFETRGRTASRLVPGRSRRRCRTPRRIRAAGGIR